MGPKEELEAYGCWSVSFIRSSRSKEGREGALEISSSKEGRELVKKERDRCFVSKLEKLKKYRT